MDYKKYILPLVFCVTILAAFLRFYEIASIPISLYWDEISSTYNAYSILLTGKDEFGNKLPLLFRAFEDYKTPANIYLTSVSVFLFGLNEFSARFSSAFLGTLTVPLVFFFVKNLLNKKYLNFNPEIPALLTCLLISISPWHIHFSRTGFEANTGLFFVILGAYLFLKYLNVHKYKYYFLSFFIFAVSMYFYRSIWIFTPLLILSLLLVYRKELFSKNSILKTSIGLLVFILTIMPFSFKMISAEGMVRANQTSVINNSDEKVFEAAIKQNENKSIFTKIAFNRRTVYILESSTGYLKHFSPNYLFLKGDGNMRHGLPNTGVLYFWGLLFIIPGLFFLKNIDSKTRFVIISWLLIAPIPAAFSLPAPHALRSLNMIPIPQLLISMGILYIFIKLSKSYRKIYSFVVFLIILFSFGYYLKGYYGEYPRISSSDWADGYKQLVYSIQKNENNYDKILISGHYWQPYSYFLFYNRYDPLEFQKNGSKSGFGKYMFGGTSWDKGTEFENLNLEKFAETTNFLSALSPVEYEKHKESLNLIEVIKSEDGNIIFYISEYNAK